MGCGNSKAKAPAAAAPAEEKQAEQAVDATVVTLLDEEKKPQPEGTKEEAAKIPKGEVEQVEQAAVEALQPTVVKVEIIGARGLKDEDWLGTSEPYCIVEIEGKPESRVQTEKSTSAKEPEWNHAAEIAGYEAGKTLVFTVKDCDPLMDDVLGKATVTVEQIQMGYIGELTLTGTGEGKEAFLKVKVGEPGMLEEAKDAVLETLDDVREAVDDAKEKIDDKIQDAKEAIDDKVQEARVVLNDALDQVETAAEAAGVQIDDETKAVFCRC